MSVRDPNRFKPFRGILTSRVDTNNRVDYFLHILHDLYVNKSNNNSASVRFKQVVLRRLLGGGNASPFTNSTFDNTIKEGNLCTGLDNTLSFEFLMFLSDVSAHLNAVQNGNNKNREEFIKSVTSVLGLSSEREAGPDRKNRVSKGFLLKIIELICTDITTSNNKLVFNVNNRNRQKTHLNEFVGNCTSITMRKGEDWIQNFSGLFDNGFKPMVKARVGNKDFDASMRVIPTGFRTNIDLSTLPLSPLSQAFAPGEILDPDSLPYNLFDSLSKQTKDPNDFYTYLSLMIAYANKGMNKVIGRTLRGTPINEPTMEEILTIMYNEANKLQPDTTTANPSLTQLVLADVDITGNNIGLNKNLTSKMRITDTHPALFWEYKKLWKESVSLSNKVNCDLKKHYVATIALAGGIRKGADTTDVNKKFDRGMLPHRPLKTTNEFPDPIIHITSANFEGGDARSQLQWTSSLSNSHQVYLVMKHSTVKRSMDKIKNNSNKKWSGEGAGLLRKSDKAWHALQSQGWFVNASGQVNYPEKFHFPATFDKLESDKNDRALESNNNEHNIGDFWVSYRDRQIDEKINILIKFWKTNKSVTENYNLDCVEQESELNNFSTNMARFVQNQLKNGSVLPINNSLYDEEEHVWSEYTNDNGMLMDKNHNEASVESYTRLGLMEPGPKCYTLGSAAAADKEKCNNFMTGCLHGNNIDKCKDFMLDPNFWSIQADDVDDMLPLIGEKILERFGFKKIQTNDNEEHKYESYESWINKLKNDTNNGGLSFDEVKRIASNVQLTTWLRRVVSKMNTIPGYQMTTKDQLSNSYLVEQVGLNVKQSKVTSQITNWNTFVRSLYQRRARVRVHLFGGHAHANNAILVGGGIDNDTDMELLAYNARTQMYESITYLETLFEGLKKQLQQKGKEIAPQDLQEIKTSFKSQKTATDKLIKYMKYMEKYAVLKELYGVNDPNGNVIGLKGMNLLIQKNKHKFENFISEEDKNIAIITKVKDLLGELA